MSDKEKTKNPVKAYLNAVDKFTDNVILPAVHSVEERMTPDKNTAKHIAPEHGEVYRAP